MRRIDVAEVKDLVEYEKVREAMRAEVIALKRRRRVALGDQLSLVFENRSTVIFQIQEMVRAERIVHDHKLRDEVEVYNGLIPGAGELSATLFIEILDLQRMSQQQVREAVNRFQGLDRDCVWLKLGDAAAIPARFEEGHTTEEKMAAVHYLRFRLSAQEQAALGDPATPARLLAGHPNYKAEAVVTPELRAELLADLRG